MTKILNLQGIHPKKEGEGAPSVTTSANAAPAPSIPAAAPPSAAEGQAAPVPTAPSATAPQASAPAQAVDVEKALAGLASKSGQKLNWQTSIVDLMKLLDMDSSLSARKQLAEELRYTGDTNDSATMNVWLHKQVMHKLEENGGKVPDSHKNHS
ncbi:DUF3597 domain-containing protein [Microvirga sp. BT291]|nr:DUF3597 domain-containing protein [Microvirga pudoricolor]